MTSLVGWRVRTSSRPRLAVASWSPRRWKGQDLVPLRRRYAGPLVDHLKPQGGVCAAAADAGARDPGREVQQREPPRLSISRISSVAYALDGKGSLQKTGRASFFGSNVSSNIELCRGRPTRSRLGIWASVLTTSAKHRGAPPADHLAASLTPLPQTLMGP